MEVLALQSHLLWIPQRWRQNKQQALMQMSISKHEMLTAESLGTIL